MLTPPRLTQPGGTVMRNVGPLPMRYVPASIGPEAGRRGGPLSADAVGADDGAVDEVDGGRGVRCAA